MKNRSVQCIIFYLMQISDTPKQTHSNATNERAVEKIMQCLQGIEERLSSRLDSMQDAISVMKSSHETL